MDDELGHEWSAADEWHPLFRLWLVAPESWKPVVVFDYGPYWLRQADLDGSAEDRWGLS
jgi:hypothetical protein